jgi:hypothetical protein
MNQENDRSGSGVAYAVAILGSFLIVGALGWAIHHYTQPAPLGAERAAFRARTLAEIRASETEALNHVAWIDQQKGLVRLRIEDAMNLVERQWRNPSAARSNLIARVEKATAVAPAAPSPFE